MKPYRLFWITVKQYLCSPFLLLLLIAAPCLCLLAAQKQTQVTDDRIRIGYCIVAPEDTDIAENTDDEDIVWLAEQLDCGESLFAFYPSESPEVLRAEVAKGNAECGYLIRSDLFAQLRAGEKKDLITVLTSPHTTMSAIINESLYATIFQRLSGQVFFRYLSEDSVIAGYYPEAYSAEDVDALYQDYLTNGSTFSFTYDNNANEYHYGTTTVLTSPLRGLFAILILLSGFIGALSYYQAAEHPVFARWSVRIVRITVPMLFAGVFALICLFGLPNVPGITHSFGGFITECGKLLLYTLCCLAFLLLLTTLIPYRGILYALFPLYVMGCLIFSPVFLDATQFLPSLKTVSYFFLPTWYLL
ncbi:MAG: hypothetical protein J6O73_15355 [Lachnospiraceae bacterium]|nr:hypothetical protein [Lachnospiraceae bacterium]